MGGVVIVTGASRGIGAATAELDAARGWAVGVNFRERATEAEAVASRINASGGRAVALRADTSDEDDVRRMFDEADRALGPVTGLVNNAGVTGGKAAPLADVDVADIRRVMEVNVIGCMLCAREAIRRMSTERGGKGGTIVNISSIAASRGSPGERVYYVASKGALNAFTIGLAQEVAPDGIRVNAVSPGVTTTEMNLPERLARLAPTVPLRRIDAVRTEGDWEGWIDFFLEGVEVVADEGVLTARKLFGIVNRDRARILSEGATSPSAIRLFELLPRHPIVTIASAQALLAATRPTAAQAVRTLNGVGILVETTGRRRGRSFAYQAYIDALREGTDLDRQSSHG
jgi:NAD(P)-dependent dehydrogenase (short-subunit alcohol dehydrogenase family)